MFCFHPTSKKTSYLNSLELEPNKNEQCSCKFISTNKIVIHYFVSQRTAMLNLPHEHLHVV